MSIEIDGVAIPCGDDSTINPGGINWVTRKGNTVVGASAEVMEAKIELNVFVDGNFSFAFFAGIVPGGGATILAKADTGQTWQINGGWCSEPPPVTQKEGKAKVTFTGPPAVEILNGV
jgi:hypothetical protein